MNKTAIKNFAIWARNKLIADISYRAGLMGITADGIHTALPQSTGQTEFYDIGTAEPYAITGEAIRQRRHLVELIQRKEKDTDYKTAYKYIIEEVAYTWFNRLIAVRFMEVNDYLPSHIRVLSSDTGKLEPDLVTTPFDAELEFTNAEQQTIIDLKNENKLDEVFCLLFIKQCNALNGILPALFEKTNDYTELLLNLSVIDQEGVVYHLVHDIPEEDFDVERGGQIEIIGWLYQYYNTEPKNEAFAKSGKISKEEIPAVTQLFTPDWIVRYMVENSIGRLWIEHLRAMDESADEATLAAHFNWNYYIPETKQEPAVEEEIRKLRKERALLTPERITMIDPCMGSGHILVYGFSVLMQIYESAGYGQRDAAKSILEHNLFGLDIDDRAYQMAYFAVMMKARGYNRRILNGENSCKMYAIQESNEIADAALEDMGTNLSEENRRKALKEIKALIEEFKDAKEYGSILNVEKRDWNLLRRFSVAKIQPGQLSLDINGAEAAAEKLQVLINIAEVMANKYLSTVTNPPYMGNGSMGKKLSDFVKQRYPDARTDLYAVFIQRCGDFTIPNGLQAMITQQSWMFVTSFERLRQKLLNKCLVSMAHLGARAFDEIGGEVVQTTTFILLNKKYDNYIGTYCRLVDPNSEGGKERLFHDSQYRYFNKQINYERIPGMPYAYWCSDKMYSVFDKAISYGSVANARRGTITGNDDKFLRYWYEVSRDRFSIFYSKANKWVPMNKGGEYRKWYGNNWYVVDWENDGYEIKNYKNEKGKLRSRPQNINFFFRQGITWTYITSQQKCFRYYPTGFAFAGVGPGLFPLDERYINYMLAYNNSVVYKAIMIMMGATTISLESGEIERSPIIIDDSRKEEIDQLTQENISLCKKDWDSFEISWDFTVHPLVPARHTVDGEKLSIVFNAWMNETATRFDNLKINERVINRIFIEIYNLQDELEPEVNDQDVSVRLADLNRDIRSLLSYAVGCMFGRYSLDEEGLAYAGGSWDEAKYKSFIPDADNVIPITDEEYLEDDIISRLCDWMKVVYGKLTLEENLDFIAKALGSKGGSSREIIRNYFLNDFFKDHCQMYSVTGSGKRPVYWLFESGKQKGFKALIYLHRYNADTIGNLRIDYLHRMQRIYESEISRMQDMIDHSTNAREVGQATNRRDKLAKQLKECREYDEKLAHLALSRIELNLDDGVKINYRKVQTSNDGKFYEVLSDSKSIMANDKLWKQYTEGKW